MVDARGQWCGSSGFLVRGDCRNPDGCSCDQISALCAELEQVKRERADAKQALQNEIVAHGNTIRGKAERLAGARVDTGCKDRNGEQIYLGDKVRYRLEGPHTKSEYWNPEYEVIFVPPAFTLKHIGGGKDGGSHHFKLSCGGGNGDLEIIERGPYHAALAEPAGEAEPVHVGWAYRDKRWDEDRWHVCGLEKPRESEGREVRPIFIGTTPPNAPANLADDDVDAAYQAALDSLPGEFHGEIGRGELDRMVRAIVKAYDSKWERRALAMAYLSPISATSRD